MVTEEALRSADLREVARRIGAQAPWSDLPFIVLTQRGGGPERNPAAARLSAQGLTVNGAAYPTVATPAGAPAASSAGAGDSPFSR